MQLSYLILLDEQQFLQGDLTFLRLAKRGASSASRASRSSTMAQKAVQAVVSNVAAFAPGIVVRIGSRGASKYPYMYICIDVLILYI